MRALFYGNMGNTGFRFTRWLREKGIETVLFLQDNRNDNRSRPEWEDPNLQSNYPSWIQKFNTQFYSFLFPQREILEATRKCDIVITTGPQIITALALKKPVVFVPVGGDLTQLPFSPYLRYQLQSYIYRRRIKNVSRIVTAQEDCIWAAKLLGVSDKLVRYLLPVDVDAISGNLDRQLLAQLEMQYGKYDWIFLHPSRKNLDPNSIEYKGNEKFLQAFKTFIKSKSHVNMRLVIGMHGHHTSEFQAMIDHLQLAKYCDLIGHLPLPKLHAYMALKNVVVFDQFNSSTPSSLGGVAREALSLGAMVVMGINPQSADFIAVYGAGCPVFSAFETEDIVVAMERILSLSPEGAAAARDGSKAWARKYLHWERRIDEFVKILHEVLQDASQT